MNRPMDKSELSLRAQALAIEARGLISKLSGERLVAAKCRADALARRTELLVASGSRAEWLTLISDREQELAKLRVLTATQ